EDIIWKKQEKLERTRAEAFTEETRSGWFATLKDVLMKHNLIDKPNQIFNADESGFSDKTKGMYILFCSPIKFNIRIIRSPGDSQFQSSACVRS
ncbi:unnamed protein product, partial [Rotaria sp. Silwood2]